MTADTTLLMLGDSLVEWGDWPTLLPGIRVINRGSAGEHVEELAARLAREVASADTPDHVLIMAGTNNLLMGNTFFPAIFKSMLPRLVSLLPDVPVTLNSIMPMTLPGLPEVIHETNQQLAATAGESGCRYLDMTAPFTKLCLPITRPCFLTDGVHLSTLGYQVWAGEIARHIDDSC